MKNFLKDQAGDSDVHNATSVLHCGKSTSQGNKEKNKMNGKEEIKLWLFVEDMIVHTKFRRSHRCGIWIIRWNC